MQASRPLAGGPRTAERLASLRIEQPNLEILI